MSGFYTQTPIDLVMPLQAQFWTTTLYAVGAVIFVIYALYLAARERRLLPLLFLAGAALTLYLEPIVDVLGNAVHPQIGQYALLTTNGHTVPWAVLIGYFWYFASTPLMCWSLLKTRSLDQRFVWWTFASVVVGAALVEQIPLHFGVWVYYGEQLPKIGYMPVWWMFANTAAVMVPFILIYKLFPRLTGWRQWLVIPLMPSGAFMGHSAAGWPMYNLMGTDTVNLPVWAHYAGSASTVLLAVLVVWVLMEMAAIPLRKAKPQAA